MNVDRFDRIAKMLADRRLSRRARFASAGAGLATLALTVGPRRAPAQDAAPSASDEERTEFLFVQTFAAGSWVPKPDEDGVFLLSLTGHAAQTIYFSDRPERIVGVVPTPAFLAGLGFTPANPPNAALVARTDAGEDIVVIELLNPVYSEDFGPDGGVTLTYEARVLADYHENGLAHLAARQGEAALPGSFGPASLFIDDCSDQEITCCILVEYRDGAPYCANVAGTIGPVGFCWHFGNYCCHPCASEGEDDPQAYWNQQCLQSFSNCGANCTAFQGGSCW